MFRFAFLVVALSAGLCVLSFDGRSQNDFLPATDIYHSARLRSVVISELAGGVAVSAGLYFLWYRKHPRSHFHFFNDDAEWLQMDKVGHLTTAYNIASIQYDMMRWCGVKNDASIAIGSLTALGYMSIIEVLDGFSSKWGFSKGDMLANIVGSALFAGQQRFWREQRISLKFSYHTTIYPAYYPAELGSNFISRMVKDYNGQTYWLSVNVKSYLPAGSQWPAWLNLAAGYGAEGMIGARSNPSTINGVKIPEYPRYRQFYFGADADLFRISSPSYLFNTGTYLSKFIKIPSPVLEWNTQRKLVFHPVYY